MCRARELLGVVVVVALLRIPREDPAWVGLFTVTGVRSWCLLCETGEWWWWLAATSLMA
jgi:hypothetical protein